MTLLLLVVICCSVDAGIFEQFSIDILDSNIVEYLTDKELGYLRIVSKQMKSDIATSYRQRLTYHVSYQLQTNLAKIWELEQQSICNCGMEPRQITDSDEKVVHKLDCYIKSWMTCHHHLYHEDVYLILWLNDMIPTQKLLHFVESNTFLIEAFDGIKNELLLIDARQPGLRTLQDHLFNKMHRFAQFLSTHPVSDGTIGYDWESVRDSINMVVGAMHGSNAFASDHYKWWKNLIDAWKDISNIIYRDLYNRLILKTTKHQPWEYTIYWIKFWHDLYPIESDPEYIQDTKIKILEDPGFKRNMRLFIGGVNIILDSIPRVEIISNISKDEKFRMIEDIDRELKLIYFPFHYKDPYKLWVHHEYSTAVYELKSILAGIVDSTLSKQDMTLQIAVGHCLYKLEEAYAAAIVIFKDTRILKEMDQLRRLSREYLISDILREHWI